MKRFAFLFLILSATLVFPDNPDATSASLSMWIRASDVVVGEMNFGASSYFGIIVENRSSEMVKLASDSDIGPKGPCWKISVDGPLDSRCLDRCNQSSVADQKIIGWVPMLKLSPNSQNRFSFGFCDVGAPGTYRVNAEYDGTNAPEGFFRGKLKAQTKTFSIKEPFGVDLEIIQKWRQQNPDKAYCYFPLNMNPNILDGTVLISEFPDSSYAAWVVIGDPENARYWRKFDAYTMLQSTSPLRDDEKEKEEKRARVLKSIIDNRPDYPLLADVKIKYCLWLWSIDRRAECIENLRAWTKDKDSDLSTWAKKYLDAAEKRLKEASK